MATRIVRERTLLSEADLKLPSIRLFYGLILGLLALLSITAIIPLLWGFLSALKTSLEIFAFPPTLLPKPFHNPLNWQWTNYAEALVRVKLLKYFANTLMLAFGVWFFHILPPAMAAYALSKLRLGWFKLLSIFFFATLMVPFYTILVPLYLTVRDLPLIHLNLMHPKLLGGYLAVILPAGVNAFNIFVFKSFFDEIPDDLLEAARMDGASEWRIFFWIMIPLTQSIFAVLSIFSFIFTWNDWLWPYLVISDPDRYTIMIKLYFLFKQADVPWNVMLACLMVASLPPIIVFIIFQRRILQGITLTGLKM